MGNKYQNPADLGLIDKTSASLCNSSLHFIREKNKKSQKKTPNQEYGMKNSLQKLAKL